MIPKPELRADTGRNSLTIHHHLRWPTGGLVRFMISKSHWRISRRRCEAVNHPASALALRALLKPRSECRGSPKGDPRLKSIWATKKKTTGVPYFSLPIGSMGLVYLATLRWFFMGHVGKYTIHGFYGLYWLVNRDPYNGLSKSPHNWVVYIIPKIHQTSRFSFIAQMSSAWPKSVCFLKCRTHVSVSSIWATWFPSWWNNPTKGVDDGTLKTSYPDTKRQKVTGNRLPGKNVQLLVCK